MKTQNFAEVNKAGCGEGREGAELFAASVKNFVSFATNFASFVKDFVSFVP